MRSRRYSSIVGSSFLLLLVSCLSQSAKDEQASDPKVRMTAPSIHDFDPAKAKSPEPVPSEPAPSEPETGTEEGDGVETEDPGPAAGDGGHAASGVPKISKRPKGRRPNGCLKGQMRFEGKCLRKKFVEMLLEQREEEAKRKIEEAEDPKQQISAANELIEQQISQMEESEDDLEEMIEKLEEEKRNKKHEDGP